MINLPDFLTMHGHGIYVWTAYSGVFVCLFIQWIAPFRRWRHYRHTHKKS